MIDGLRVKRADGTWTDKGAGGEQWVEPPPDLKISSGTTLFQGWTWLTTAPMLDTSSATNMSYVFSDCTSLTGTPLLDTGNVTNMSSMFDDCTSLTGIPLLDTSSATNMSYMFSGCTSLTGIPLLDTGNVTNMSSMFDGCSSLTSVPPLDTGNVTNMSSMFYGCSSLTAIEVDMSSVSSYSTVWESLSSLTSLLTHGMTRTFIVPGTAMEAPALNAWFDSLGQAASGATINITGAPGADTCDRTITTDKGWSVAG